MGVKYCAVVGERSMGRSFIFCVAMLLVMVVVMGGSRTCGRSGVAKWWLPGHVCNNLEDCLRSVAAANGAFGSALMELDIVAQVRSM